MIHIIKRHPFTGLVLLTLILLHCKGSQKNKEIFQDNYKTNNNKISIIPKLCIPKVTLEVVSTKCLVSNIKCNPIIDDLSLSSRIIKEENVDKGDYEGFVIFKHGVFLDQVQEDLQQVLKQFTIKEGVVSTLLKDNKALVFLKSNQGDDYKNIITSDNISILDIKSGVSLDVCYWKRYKDHFVVISNACKMKVKELPKNLALVGKEHTESEAGEAEIGESGIEELVAEELAVGELEASESEADESEAGEVEIGESGIEELAVGVEEEAKEEIPRHSSSLNAEEVEPIISPVSSNGSSSVSRRGRFWICGIFTSIRSSRNTKTFFISK